jgi:hypothetical protein
MNERILELAEQCWESKHYGPPWFDYKKFAELIIEEAHELIVCGGVDDLDAVKKYFGVEE